MGFSIHFFKETFFHILTKYSEKEVRKTSCVSLLYPIHLFFSIHVKQRIIYTIDTPSSLKEAQNFQYKLHKKGKGNPHFLSRKERIAFSFFVSCKDINYSLMDDNMEKMM
ncbi:hypothetical protein BHL54_19680 [Bacillus cereus]|nr:hypothetical protein BHL54_19680 [Bacillus cereus]